MSNIELTDEQAYLCEEIYKWYKTWDPRKKPCYTYSGPPGSGKTTVLREVMNAVGIPIPRVHCMALVGNAVMNLLKAGMNAKTIHSTIYNLDLILDLDENGKMQFNDKGNPKKKMDFVLKDNLNINADLLVLDEGGMVSDDHINNVLSYEYPTIILGDMNQLGPVYGKCTYMEKPDFHLTKIMRQAEGDPIIQLCQDVLHDRPLKYGQYKRSRVIHTSDLDTGMSLLNDYDMIICGKNKTKESINKHIRENLLGLHPLKPYIGDRIIARANDWGREIDGFFLVNGMSGTIEDIHWNKSDRKKTMIDFKPNFLENECFYDVPLDNVYLNLSANDKNNYGMSRFNKFDYGYAISTHLSQGSQYSRVLFFDEYFPSGYEFMKRIRYTAISRAIDSVTIVNNMGSDMLYQ